MATLVARTIRAFREQTGSPPDGVWCAPGRVNLIGEHLDYNGGHVLPFAITKSVAVALRRRGDDRIRCWSTLDAGVAATTIENLVVPENWARYVIGIMRVLCASGSHLGGLDLVVDADLPAGAGLASSAALTSATALALSAVFDLGLSQHDLARHAQRAESEFGGAPIGPMDHLAVLCATSEHAALIDCIDRTIVPIPLTPAVEDLTLLLADTGSRHDIASSAYRQRREACATAAQQLRIPSLRDAGPGDLPRIAPALRGLVRHVIGEERRVLAAADLLRRGRYREVGTLMNASHVSLRHDFDVSSPELDVAVHAAQSNGAFGARLTGGGFGGSVIVLAPIARADDISAAIGTALEPFGLRAHVEEVHPANGARQEADGLT
jgi:galactokinase